MIRSDLTPEEFNSSPVWCWTDDEENYMPVLEYSPLPDDMGVLFLKAKLTFADGTKMEGCITGCTSFHSFSVFHNGFRFTVNLRSKELMERGLQRLWNSLNREIALVFPISFETDFLYSSGEKVQGELQPKFWK